MAPGRGPVKIAAALTIAAAGFGGGFAYKRFRRYLDERKLRKEREESRQARKEQKAKSSARKRSTQKRPRTRKRSATKSKRQPARSGIS
jgi:Sec-independent protein translocase protein TatA